MTRDSSASSGRSATRKAGDLTVRQAAVLLALLSQKQPISNKELQDRFSYTLVGDERRRLNELGLVDSRKISGHGNVLFHELTDSGWNRAFRELTPNADFTRLTVPAGLMFAFAEGVARFLEREQRSLGETLGTDADAEPARRSPAGADADGLEAAIRAAYAKLAVDPHDWVRLADVRPLLGAVDRENVDRALKEMARRPDVRVVPDEDQKSLTAADRDAAVRIGDHDNHLLLIGP
jgi:DNA-binding MarR family transcriptional regulator